MPQFRCTTVGCRHWVSKYVTKSNCCEAILTAPGATEVAAVAGLLNLDRPRSKPFSFGGRQVVPPDRRLAMNVRCMSRCLLD